MLYDKNNRSSCLLDSIITSNLLKNDPEKLLVSRVVSLMK